MVIAVIITYYYVFDAIATCYGRAGIMHMRHKH